MSPTAAVAYGPKILVGRGQRPRLQRRGLVTRALPHQRFDFAGICPFIRWRNQPGTHRIIENVIPFLAVALVGAQNVIKEVALPQCCSRDR
ncbi:MAG: hypothetical protein DMF03_02490 [Verrucomicrobia bacterium]|nr:MAG: hypothetical protein DMF03_02490 [Verrucomicrobiota bacterium]